MKTSYDLEARYRFVSAAESTFTVEDRIEMCHQYLRKFDPTYRQIEIPVPKPISYENYVTPFKSLYVEKRITKHELYNEPYTEHAIKQDLAQSAAAAIISDGKSIDVIEDIPSHEMIYRLTIGVKK